MLKVVANMMPAPHTKDTFVSTGRGGAGNLGPSSPQLRPTIASLKTPTIKKDTYTTGRGGAGNMSRNLPEVPEMARAAQDVYAEHSTARRESMHSGRGGAGNFHRSPKVKAASPSLKGKAKDGDASSVHSGGSSVLVLDDDEVVVVPGEKKKGRAESRSSQLGEKAGAMLGKLKRGMSSGSGTAA